MAGTKADTARARFARRLQGRGLELGPGNYPFRILPPDVEVRYVDRWASDTIGQLSDFGASLTAHYRAAFVEPDITLDFNRDRLRPVPDGGEDFVIASHLLEHLAEPIGFLDEVHRVLGPGGLFLLLLPDRLRTEDRFRAPTPLGHLVEEHGRGVEEVSDEHLREFLRDRGVLARWSPAKRRAQIALHRDRSVHVHCWTQAEFAQVLLWGIEHLGHTWELVDACTREQPIHYEFGFLLRKGAAGDGPQERARAFRRAWERWQAEEARRRPGVFDPPRQVVPARVAQGARRLVRSNRVAAWGYQRALAASRRAR
ncbi:MAG TPA: methyltransferase domain-containing protein, partial [Acidimicrobiales bacterium]|nr:methyltransferase domain-containing protein [Acidimicrobiales bacterium]